jgi:hypothetical protein
VIDKFLILGCSFFAAMQSQIGFASHIRGMQRCSPIGREWVGPNFGPAKRFFSSKRFVTVTLHEFSRSGCPFVNRKHVETIVVSELLRGPPPVARLLQGPIFVVLTADPAPYVILSFGDPSL